MDKIIRCITDDGSLMASAIDSSDLVYTAQSLHKLTRTTAAAFGRLLTGASIMGAMLKRMDSTLTVKINGGGPAGTLLAWADAKGNVRGYVDHPEVDLPLRADGKINVGAAVGRDGLVAVIRDEGEGEPYIGHTELVSGEIAEDLTAYYAYSEQIPTVMALGVLVGQEDGKVMLSGGIMLQVLPGAAPDAIDKLEANVAKLESVTTMLAQGITPLEMCQRALDGYTVEVLDSFEINYICNCSKEKFGDMMLTLTPEDIRTMPLVHNHMAETVCPYCNKKYLFSSDELEKLAQQAEKKGKVNRAEMEK